MKNKKQKSIAIFLTVLILLSGSLLLPIGAEAGEEGKYRVMMDTQDPDKTDTIRTSEEEETREPKSPLDLRFPSGFEPRQWIYEGETFKAELEVHNQWTEKLDGVILVVGEGIRVYGIGTLEADETKTREVRIYPDDYEEGENEIELEAQHENGTASKTINFRVLSESAPVEVFLASTNSPVYEMQTLEFSLVVAAAKKSGVEDLVVRAGSENVTPEGYWVGEEMKEVAEMGGIGEGDVDGDELSPIVGDGDLLPEGGGDEDGSRVIVGRELIFEMKNTGENGGFLDFEMTYQLGNRSVEENFQVDYDVKSSGSVSLIEADPTKGEKGKMVVISLEISNEKDIEVGGVKVRPVETSDVDPEEVDIYPNPYYWIGPLSSDGFLPLEIRVDSDDLEDGDKLRFEPVYRVGDGEMTGDPVEVTVELSEAQNESNLLYYLGFVVVVGLGIFVFYWRKR